MPRVGLGELISALRQAGFETACASDLQALLKLEAFNPDITIVDEVLSSGDGIEACRTLRPMKLVVLSLNCTRRWPQD